MIRFNRSQQFIKCFVLTCVAVLAMTAVHTEPATPSQQRQSEVSIQRITSAPPVIKLASEQRRAVHGDRHDRISVKIKKTRKVAHNTSTISHTVHHTYSAAFLAPEIAQITDKPRLLLRSGRILAVYYA